MRKSSLFLSLALSLSLLPMLRAQDPGSRQDAEEARQRLLKAADQLDNIQANSEATKNSVDGMKNDVATLQQTVTRLQTENASLRQQLTELQASLDQYKDEQLKARQKLIDDVAGMLAAAHGGTPTATTKKKKADDSDTTSSASPSEKPKTAANLAPPPDKSPSAPSSHDTPAPAKPEKGYYHVVAPGETLTMIVEAYRDNGVLTTSAEIRKANGLSDKSGVKAGQKLFIPKPGT